MPENTSGVRFTRAELQAVTPAYRLIKDCDKGEIAVKKRSTVYLPQPNPQDESEENQLRYDAYKERAVFYNVTQRTLHGLTGEVFRRDPVLAVPPQLEPLISNADGSGLSLTQVAKRAARWTLALGRSGILTDYPNTEGGASVADLEERGVQPTIRVYDPEEIINWRTRWRNGKRMLELVVLLERYDDFSLEFDAVERVQYRELRLVEGVYTVRLWNHEGVLVEGPIVPVDAAGDPFTEIPFSFIGSENNDVDIDEPPLYPIASLNIAHYRNSADYEESSYVVGQPTPVLAGLTEEWARDVLKGEAKLGSRAAIMLPVGATATLLQPEPNIMPKEAMEHKERQMVALGARLVENKDVERTATEVSMEETSQSSILASVAKNVSTAVEQALVYAAMFVGVDTAEISFELNTDFAIARLSPEERRQLVGDWQAGLLAFPEARTILRKHGLTSMDDAEAEKIIAVEQAAMAKLKIRPVAGTG